MNWSMKHVMITGGAGFIGCHVVKRLVRNHPDWMIYCLDALTYAGNAENLKAVEGAPNYAFVQADIKDFEAMERLVADKKIDMLVHLAAESHVDRSIKDPFVFARTNVMGTLNLLEACKRYWSATGFDGKRYYQVSTDEVYGTLTMAEAPFDEVHRYDPHSPYSASKASADHFVRAYHDTYGLPTLISNCSNNYGPNQFPEKLIPLFIHNIRHGKPLPIYGKGENVRDWLYVEDHAAAIEAILLGGAVGETYNIGGNEERQNVVLVRTLIEITDRLLGNAPDTSLPLMTFVRDREGHDLRYAINSSKIRRELGWKPSVTFEEGLERTVQWYLDNAEWLEHVTSGSYRSYYQEMYGGR